MDPQKVEELLRANAADNETQEARKQACKGKKLLWFTSFYTAEGYRYGVKAMLDDINELGISFCVVLDPALEDDRKMVEMMKDDGMLEMNSYLLVDISDSDKAVENTLAAIKEKNLVFDAAFGTSEHIQQLAAVVAAELGLPHNPSEAYTIARDKRLARDSCREHNIPTPRYDYLYGEDDIERIAEKVRFPCVMKPSHGCGSMGVVRCDDVDQLRKAFKSVNSELTEDKMYTWNPALGTQNPPKILVEQYLDGKEVDVDVLMWDGQVVYSNIIDNWPCIEPYFQEIAAHCPTQHVAYENDLKEFAKLTLMAMGFTQGAFHVELKYSEIDQQAYLIEVNTRMGGGGTRMCHKDCYDVDLFTNFVMSALGIPINPPRSLVPLCGRVYYDVNALKTGILAHTRWLDHLKTHPNVTYVLYRKEGGEKVQGLDTGLPDWVANIHIKAPTIDEALDIIRELEKTIYCPLLETDGKIIEVPAVTVSHSITTDV